MDRQEQPGSNKRQRLGEDAPVVEPPKEPPTGEAPEDTKVAADSHRESDDDDSESAYDSDSSGESLLFRFKRRLQTILENQRDSEDDNEEDCDDDSVNGPAAEFEARVSMINGACGAYFQAKEVRGRHRTECDDCFSIPSYGMYACDQSDGVYYAPKLCESCVVRRSDLLIRVTEDKNRYRKIKKMQKKLQRKLQDQKLMLFSPFVRGGLFEVGPDGPFRINSLEEPKSFKEYMNSKPVPMLAAFLRQHRDGGP